MELHALKTVWLDVTETAAPQQENFIGLYVITCWVWIAFAVWTFAQAAAHRSHARFLAALANSLYALVTLLMLAGILLDYYASGGTIVAVLGGAITFFLFGSLAGQINRPLIRAEGKHYVYAGLATIAVNGLCCMTFIAS